jgi:hypothetical protein
LQSPLFGVGERREDGRRSEGVCRNERHSLNSEPLQKTIEFGAKQRVEKAVGRRPRSSLALMHQHPAGPSDGDRGPGANLKES